ncbi:MAG: exopolysaccharide biosynthesis polyprenyl glycosylphosphotransferase [Candidatus Binatia bacterium]
MIHPALIESACLFVAIFVALYLWPAAEPWPGAALARAIAPAVICTASCYYLELHDLASVRSLREFLPRLVRASVLSALLLAALYLLVPDLALGGGPAASTATVVLLFAALALPLRAVLHGMIESRWMAERVLLVGCTRLTHQLVEAIEAERHCRMNIVGVTDAESGESWEISDVVLRYPFVSPLGDLARLTEKTRPDRIIVAVTGAASEIPDRTLLELRGRGIVIENGLEAYERLTGSLPLDFIALKSVIFSKDFRPARLPVLFARAASLVCAGLALLVLLPVFALIALAIKLESSGPVFFVQERIGLHGRAFRLLKFRTMHPAPPGASEWAAENFHRITRVGHWLRRCHLDELPQFVNIVLGHMNLVGPRPHPVSNYGLFLERIPCYAIRSVIRPGLTGWAQVRSGYANGLDEERKKMCYDLFYLKHLSFWLDVRILIDTLKAVVLAQGSGVSARPERPPSLAPVTRAGDAAAFAHETQDGAGA